MELFGDISPKTINVRVLCHKSTSRGGACGGIRFPTHWRGVARAKPSVRSRPRGGFDWGGGPELVLPRPTYAMTEQPRAISRERIVDVAGVVDAQTMAEVDMWLRDFLPLG